MGGGKPCPTSYSDDFMNTKRSETVAVDFTDTEVSIARTGSSLTFVDNNGDTLHLALPVEAWHALRAVLTADS